MKTKKFELEELLYTEGCYAIPYVDIEKADIIIVNEDDDEIVCESLLRVPSKEELVPYNEAMWHFINERHIVIPEGLSAGRFLREQSQMYDFYSYWDKMASEQLTKWIESIQFNC